MDRDWDAISVGVDVLLELISSQSIHELSLGLDNGSIVKL